jgi:hypothetical protein
MIHGNWSFLLPLQSVPYKSSILPCHQYRYPSPIIHHLPTIRPSPTWRLACCIAAPRRVTCACVTPQQQQANAPPLSPIYTKILPNPSPNPVHLETATGGPNQIRKGSCRDKPSGFNLRGTREVREYPFFAQVRFARGRGKMWTCKSFCTRRLQGRARVCEVEHYIYKVSHA